MIDLDSLCTSTFPGSVTFHGLPLCGRVAIALNHLYFIKAPLTADLTEPMEASYRSIKLHLLIRSLQKRSIFLNIHSLIRLWSWRGINTE